MTCKVTVQKNTFSESLAIVGRAVGSHSHLPILSNILLSKDEDQLRLSATDLTVGVTVWMDANLDGDLGFDLTRQNTDRCDQQLNRSRSRFFGKWETGSIIEVRNL